MNSLTRPCRWVLRLALAASMLSACVLTWATAPAKAETLFDSAEVRTSFDVSFTPSSSSCTRELTIQARTRLCEGSVTGNDEDSAASAHGAAAAFGQLEFSPEGDFTGIDGSGGADADVSPDPEEMGAVGADAGASISARFEVLTTSVMRATGDLSRSGSGCGEIAVGTSEQFETLHLTAVGCLRPGAEQADAFDEERTLEPGFYFLVASAEASVFRTRTASSASAAGEFSVDVEIIPCQNSFTDGPDEIVGSAGADVLCGGDGDDSIRGLGGNDRLFGGPGDDVLDGGVGEDHIQGGPSSTSGLTGFNNLTGGPGDDDLVGGDRVDIIAGGTGVDRVEGGRGADVIDGGPGDDELAGGDGRDQIVGGDGKDRIDGGPDADNIDVGQLVGSPSVLPPGLSGGPGVDTIIGGPGDDLIQGGGELDQLEGGFGRDKLRGGAGGDGIVGGPGRDVLNGGTQGDTLRARDARRDRVLGGPGQDRARVDAVDELVGVEIVS